MCQKPYNTNERNQTRAKETYHVHGLEDSTWQSLYPEICMESKESTMAKKILNNKMRGINVPYFKTCYM